ncbi:MAG: HlyD family efflux transporter periplasmic adaptor subunit [Nostocales cyanobacterium ELA608]
MSFLNLKKLFTNSQDLLESKVASNPRSILLSRSSRYVAYSAWILVGTSVVAFIWLCTARTEEVVISTGKLEPIGDTTAIQMPQGGVLKSILVKEGQIVRQGQPLIQLDSESSTDRLVNIRDSIASKKREMVFKEVEFNRFLDLNTNEQRFSSQSLNLDSKILQRLDVLRRQGAAAELQYLQQVNKVKEDESNLSKSRTDRLRQSSVFSQQIETLRAELSELSSKLTDARVANKYELIKSPVAGIVFDLKPNSPGFVGQGSEVLLKVVPRNQLKAKVEVDSSKIGFVRVGQSADISIDSYPSNDFGVLGGVIKQIGSDVLPPDQLNKTFRFPVTIDLNSQTLKLKGSASPLPLQVGMTITANIKLRKVTYMQLLLSNFKQKSDSLRSI